MTTNQFAWVVFVSLWPLFSFGFAVTTWVILKRLIKGSRLLAKVLKSIRYKMLYEMLPSEPTFKPNQKSETFWRLLHTRWYGPSGGR